MYNFQKMSLKEEACPFFLFLLLDCGNVDIMAGAPATFLDYEATLVMKAMCSGTTRLKKPGF